MEYPQLQWIETIALIFSISIVRFLISMIIRKVGKTFHFHKPRVSVVKKITNTIFIFIFLALLLLIWGVDQRDLLLYTSSILTILGVAFFAQWSLLSNVTAAIILFVNHPVKIGNRIKILDKDYPIEGVINDIGAFFVIIKTEEGEKVTLPTSLLLQKMVKIETTKENDQSLF